MTCTLNDSATLCSAGTILDPCICFCLLLTLSLSFPLVIFLFLETSPTQSLVHSILHISTVSVDYTIEKHTNYVFCSRTHSVSPLLFSLFFRSKKLIKTKGTLICARHMIFHTFSSLATWVATQRGKFQSAATSTTPTQTPTIIINNNIEVAAKVVTLAKNDENAITNPNECAGKKWIDLIEKCR